MRRIGILSLQGDVSEHIVAMENAIKVANINAMVICVNSKKDLPVDALVIPGGESTTIGKLLIKTGLYSEIKKLAKNKVPIMGTCTGLILLAKKGDAEVKKTRQPLLKLMNTRVNRNAFGRQRESFETDLEIPVIGKEPFHGVFIRAPSIEEVWGEAKILARLDKNIAMAQQDNILAMAFHPELTSDTRIHEYFLNLI